MAIVRYDPFSLLNHPFFRPLADITEEWPEYTLSDGLNVYEEDNQVIIEAAVPGIPGDKLDITYEDGVLHISGRVEEKEEEKKKNRIVHRQQKVSSFNYTTVLPRPIDPESVTAQVENGVVRVSAQIAKAAQAKKIPVKISSK